MAQIKISNHAGTEFASIINNPAGSIYADQIYWGNGSYFVTEDNTFSTTEELLAAINAKIKDAKDNGGLKETAVKELVTAYYSEAALTDEQIGEKISAYMTNNSVIPSLSKGTATKPSASTVSSFSYIADFNVSNHTITPVYGTINVPTIPNLSKTDVEGVDSTYYISDFTVSGHTITPVYTKLTEYTHPAAKDLWNEFK